MLSRNFCEKSVRENFCIFHTVVCTLWKLRDSTATVFSQKFRQINVLPKNFTINWFDGKNFRGSEFLVFPHCEGTRENFLPFRFYVKSTLFNFSSKNVALTKFLKKCVRVNLGKVNTTVRKLQKFSLTLFSQKFRESNGFTKEISK